MTDTPTAQRLSPLVALVAAVVPVVTAAAIGNAATLPNIPTWYAGLVKPAINPPNWIFGPVWTTLYLMMILAFWRVLRAEPAKGRRAASLWFLAQMALNALWSVAFFAGHSPLGGLAVILPLLGAIVVTMRLFARIDRLAGLLLVPYVAWVSFASLLNFLVWKLN